MSENETSTTDVGNRDIDEPVLPPLRTHQDWLLQELVRYANEWGISASVTLNLGGVMVSGQLISLNDYLDGFAANFKAGFNGGELGQTFFDLISSYKPMKRDPDVETPQPAPHYIHLKEVRIYSPGKSHLPVRSALWRGRISEVSGFILGEPEKVTPK